MRVWWLLLLGFASGYYIVPEEPEQYAPFELNELEDPYQSEVRYQDDELRIPGEKPDKNETYLCTAFYQPRQTYVVGFKPLADKHKIHHILIFGCDAPGIQSEVPAWSCGDTQNTPDSRYEYAPPCATTQNIIYAWAKGAPELNLPEGVAFPVGPGTKNRFLVVQVHYMHAMDKSDYSGVRIRYTETQLPRTAATMLMVTGGVLPAMKKESFDAACVIDEDIVMHPFAFRVHTHGHGQTVKGFVVNEDPATGEDKWTLIGERDPQKEQLFEEVKNQSIVIKPGDVVASRCVMESKEDRDVFIGPTGADEMCNFYLMYWVDGEQTLQQNTCYSPGAPTYRWSEEAGLNNIPQK